MSTLPKGHTPLNQVSNKHIQYDLHLTQLVLKPSFCCLDLIEPIIFFIQVEISINSPQFTINNSSFLITNEAYCAHPCSACSLRRCRPRRLPPRPRSAMHRWHQQGLPRLREGCPREGSWCPRRPRLPQILRQDGAGMLALHLLGRLRREVAHQGLLIRIPIIHHIDCQGEGRNRDWKLNTPYH